MKLQLELCCAVGCNLDRMAPMEVYFTAGRIIADQKLTAKAREMFPGPILPAGARVKAIAAMTPQERRELLERVCGVVRMPIKKST